MGGGGHCFYKILSLQEIKPPLRASTNPPQLTYLPVFALVSSFSLTKADHWAPDSFPAKPIDGPISTTKQRPPHSSIFLLWVSYHFPADWKHCGEERNEWPHSALETPPPTDRERHFLPQAQPYTCNKHITTAGTNSNKRLFCHTYKQTEWCYF